MNSTGSGGAARDSDRDEKFRPIHQYTNTLLKKGTLLLPWEAIFSKNSCTVVLYRSTSGSVPLHSEAMPHRMDASNSSGTLDVGVRINAIHIESMHHALLLQVQVVIDGH